ncbi:hypothetical protein [Botrimarina sp.]|uniref:hypothetical protein n=1 Tax=Botrimarina sp. TaxID=2795802 RepID=UPI0032EB6E87
MTRLQLALATALACLPSAARSQNKIGVNFIGGVDSPASSVTGVAGVPAVAQGNWNNVAPDDPTEVEDLQDFIGSATGLIDSTGAPTPLGVSWIAEETYAAGNGAIDNEDERLMDGFIDVDDSAPTSFITLSDIPYAGYDIYVYVGTDGLNRTANVQLGDDGSSRIWFKTSTGGGQFTGPDDYVQATATTEDAAFSSNYIVYEGLIASELEVRITRGSGNSGIHGIQIIEQPDVAFLTLRIDTVTGMVELRNDSAGAVDLDAYQISSPSGSLDEAALVSLEQRDFEGAGPPGAGDGWEELGAPGASLIAEAYLAGSSEAWVGESILLGKAFRPGASEDVVFRYHETDGFTKVGRVEYCEGCVAFLDGDYTLDGRVDAADYTVWRDTLGSTTDLRANGDNSGPSAGAVDSADYGVWRSNYGSAAGEPTAAVPEPSALGLLACAATLGLAANRRRAIGATLLLLAVGAPHQAAAQSIGVNFIGGIGSSASSVTGVAGAPGVEQANWNNVAQFVPGQVDGEYDTLGTAGGLVTSLGEPTSMSVSWLADNTWAADNPSIDNEDERLLDGYVDNSTDLVRSFFTLEDIPFAGYDLYIYVGSDGNGRRSYTQLGDDGSSAVWFETNTGQGAFTGPGDYVRATADSVDSAIPSNYVVYEGLLSPDLQFSINRGTGNAGVHGFQLVERDDIPFLSLLVDRVTGFVQLRNDSSAAVDFDLYQIRSEAGALVAANFQSLQAQDFDLGGPSNDGSGWETLGTGAATYLAEGYLQGDSTMDVGESINLGRIFGLGGHADLELRFHETDSVVKPGRVEYCDGCIDSFELRGDFNADGRVDAADYTVWRDDPSALPADSYAVWSSSYGQVAPTFAAGASVPEPSALLMRASAVAVCAASPLRRTLRA